MHAGGLHGFINMLQLLHTGTCAGARKKNEQKLKGARIYVVISQRHWCGRRTVGGLFLLVPSLSTVPPPPPSLSPLLVAVVFVRLGEITKSCFVKGCSC